MRREGSPQRRAALVMLVALIAAPLLARAGTPDFSGTWEFAPSRSQNLGMMAAVKVTLVATQTPRELRILETSVFDGTPSVRELRYDLGGAPAQNEGPMGGRQETVARWSGQRLVVTWTAPGAIAGTQVVRTETRSLSADRATMNLESVRGSNPPVVMVFERRK
jgi:hypothetical protein